MFVLLAVLPQVGFAQTENDNPRKFYSSYCGVDSLYRAIKAIGRDIRYEDLVQAKYIGSKQGSSLEELMLAVSDNGLHALPAANMRMLSLLFIDRPTLLHFKGTSGRTSFNHWVLFTGINQNGNLSISSSFEPPILMTFEEVAERWDGIGLIVSAEPISKLYYYYLPITITLGLYVLIFAILLQVLRAVKLPTRHSGVGFGSPSVSSALRATQEACTLFTISVLVGIIYSTFSLGGFLSYTPAIKEIQDSYVFMNFHVVPLSKVVEVITKGGVIIDARSPLDYRAGHIKGSLNLPPNSSEREIQSILTNISKDKGIVIYCQSNGCPYSKQIGEKLSKLGYRIDGLYKNGWTEWKSVMGESTLSDYTALGK